MNRIAILAGPTASGKSGIAHRFARNALGIEIINADSMIVYRGMDIGTAKPEVAERSLVPHHLIDIRDPDQGFTAGEFFRECETAIRDILSRGKKPLIVGGTGFYLKALLFGLWDAPASDPVLRARLEEQGNAALHRELENADPKAALRIGTGDRYRLLRAVETLRMSGRTPSELESVRPKAPDSRFELLIMDRSDEELGERIAKRTSSMLASGLLQETRRLSERYRSTRALRAVGYAQTLAYLDDKKPAGRKPRPGLGGLEDEIVLATRQLVKSQRTFFRGLKSGRWFELDRDLGVLDETLREIYGG